MKSRDSTGLPPLHSKEAADAYIKQQLKKYEPFHHSFQFKLSFAKTCGIRILNKKRELRILNNISVLVRFSFLKLLGKTSAVCQSILK